MTARPPKARDAGAVLLFAARWSTVPAESIVSASGSHWWTKLPKGGLEPHPALNLGANRDSVPAGLFADTGPGFGFIDTWSDL